MDHIVGEHPGSSKDEHVGLDTQFPQFLYRVLRGLCLQLPAADFRYQGEVYEQDVLRSEVTTHLACCFKVRDRLIVSNGPADLYQGHIYPGRFPTTEILRLISSVMCGMIWTVRPR